MFQTGARCWQIVRVHQFFPGPGGIGKTRRALLRIAEHLPAVGRGEEAAGLDLDIPPTVIAALECECQALFAAVQLFGDALGQLLYLLAAQAQAADQKEQQQADADAQGQQ